MVRRFLEERHVSEFQMTESVKMRLFEDVLHKDLTLKMRVTGQSMASFLTGGEILTMRKIEPRSLRIGDLIFFKTSKNVPIIHRIVKKKSRGDAIIFWTKGDALVDLDEPVNGRNILGKVCTVEKKCEHGTIMSIDMESPEYRIINYVCALLSLFNSALRRMLYRVRQCGKRSLRQCRRRH